jgi:hypothetical protein
VPDLRPETPSRPRDVPFPAPKVAALFVEYKGVYFNRSDVVPEGYAKGNDQDKTTVIVKDARSYDGPWPVVAHPPCNSWGQVARTIRLTRDGHAIGNDGGCFESALKSVREWGGVIEHPAGSTAWTRYTLRKPRTYCIPSRDRWGGFSITVNQSHYGHMCQKPTWLYICGYRGDFEEDFYIPQSKKRVKYRISFSGGNCQKNHPMNKTTTILPDHLRKRTPELFADLLVSIAKRCTFYRDHWSYHVPQGEST